MQDATNLRAHVFVVCGSLGLPGTSCTQEQLVAGVHNMAGVLLQLTPRLVEVSAVLRKATSPTPWNLQFCSTNKLQGRCYCTASRHCDARRNMLGSVELKHMHVSCKALAGPRSLCLAFPAVGTYIWQLPIQLFCPLG